MLVTRNCTELTFNLGILKILKSLVTVPTTTAILSARSSPFIFLINLAIEIGGLLILDINRRRSTISLNLASVRRAKKRYNLTRSLKQMSSDLGAVLRTFRSLLCLMSTPWKWQKWLKINSNRSLLILKGLTKFLG